MIEHLIQRIHIKYQIINENILLKCLFCINTKIAGEKRCIKIDHTNVKTKTTELIQN